jgi:hypothetical protein
MNSELELRDDRWGPAVGKKGKKKRKEEKGAERAGVGLAADSIRRAGRCERTGRCWAAGPKLVRSVLTLFFLYIFYSFTKLKRFYCFFYKFSFRAPK